MGTPSASLRFHGRLSNLGSVSALVQNVCRDLNLDEITSYHVELAVIEAVTNSMRHAFDGEIERPMHVAASVQGENLLISVSDLGRPAELALPLDEDRPVPRELEEGGGGLFLICSLMDHVEHRSDSGGNTLLMTKALARTPRPA